jgi:hypothetical protein
MSYNIICDYGNYKEEIEGKELFEDFAQNKAKEYRKLYPNDGDIHHKIMWHHDEGEALDTEITCYNRLKDSGLTPKFISGEILCKLKAYDEDAYSIDTIALVKTEKCGKSLLELYIPKELHKECGGPGEYIHNNGNPREYLRDYFPEKYIPSHIYDQVIDILMTLKDKYGIEHDDIHPGNFLQKDDKVYVIDFSCVTCKFLCKKLSYE